MATVVRRFLTGQRIAVSGLPTDRLPAATSVGVFVKDGVEIEVMGGGRAAADFFLSSTRSALTGSLELRRGTELRYGRFGGDPSQPFAFHVALGDWHLFGNTGPNFPVTSLAELLDEVSISVDAAGVAVAPAASVRLSTFRSPDVLQLLPDLCVLQIKEAHGKRDRKAAGRKVAGGQMYRAEPGSRSDYVVVDDGQRLLYFVPLAGAALNDVVDVGAQVLVQDH